MEFEEFVESIGSLDQATLKKMLERRHPKYKEKLSHWTFLEQTYDGGRDWFNRNIFQYYKEGENEYQDRKNRAYRFNHTREVVDLVNKYIFKANVHRRQDQAPETVRRFWKNATLRRRDIDEAMKLISQKASIYGKVWVVVDSTKPNVPLTIKEEKELDVRVYHYVVRPQDVLDMAFAKDGSLSWIIIRESWRDDETPFDSGKVSTNYRLWTPNYWALFTEKKNSDNTKGYEYVSAGEHGLGEVPVFPVDHITDEDLYVSQSLIDDVAYLDRAVANYLSNLDAIIQDQTFSQLVLPAQAIMPGGEDEEMEGANKLIEMGTKRIFTFDGEAAYPPTYISPSAQNANLLLAVVEKIISEIYHSTGLAGERTKQDNSISIDNSSGVAKAYDFHKMNAMLASKAAAIESAERKMVRLVQLWNSEQPSEEIDKSPLVTYPDEFDVRGLIDDLEISQRLTLVSAPKMVRREHMKNLVDKLFPTLSDDIVEKLKEEIDNEWLELPDELEASGFNNLPKPREENRQGQASEE